MAARREETLELVSFGDAPRNFFGLAPIYQDCQDRETRSEAVRFHLDAYPEGNGMAPAEGRSLVT